ncbi:protein kinase domain-containing protein [Actinospica durhamensis]|nr:protein kinase [Actinospica durhamensis]
MDRRLGSRYVLKERLGRGAMGTVWRAINTDTHTDVAVKVLSEELSGEPEMVTRFIQERNALVAVHHPNLVRIHDLVVEDGRLAIIMDLIAGPDLHRHLLERGVLGLGETAFIGRGVAAALAAIHSAGIIHRDLKPANILLDLSGPHPEPKLVDFGIARMLSSSRLTARSSVVGTPQYLSPEAISGAEPGPAVDVYALGIALYELLTGAPPFHSEQLLQVLNQHMYQEPPWPASIPAPILPLLQAMLAKNPQVRPNAAEIARQMDLLVAGGPYPTPIPQQPGTPVGSPMGLAPMPQQSPYPQPPAYPPAQLPSPYGRPEQFPPGTPQPVPEPTPSGFFYPNTAMLYPNQAAADLSQTPNPVGAVFSPNPPPFTDAMFAPKKQGERKKLYLGAGAVLGVAAVAGIAIALTGGGSSGNHPLAAGSTSAHATTSASASPTVAPSCPAQTITPTADWPLNGTFAGCSDIGALHQFGGAGFENSARGEVLKVNGQAGRATMPLGSLVDTSHSFTVSIWVDVDSLPTAQKTVVAFQGVATDAFALRYDHGWAFGYSAKDTAGAAWAAATDPKAAKTHSWTHLVGVYDASGHTLTLYVNGVKGASRNGVVGFKAVGKITLGASLNATGQPSQDLDGELSAIEVFTGAFSQTQVDALG